MVTITTYSQQFHAISKHLDIERDMVEITAQDLQRMIVSMQDAGLSPNTIRSYTITLKAFLSWCNDEGITDLNMKKYKGVETIKEAYKIFRFACRPGTWNTTDAQGVKGILCD